jgi:hypothetical protein
MRLCVGFVDWNNTGTNFVDSTKNLEGNDWVVVIFQDYELYQDSTQVFFGNPNSAWAWIWAPSSKYSVGDVVDVIFRNPVAAGEDRIVFTPSALETDLSENVLDSQLDDINVFPNPYFAFQEEETAPLDRFVRFTHLPVDGETTIRIYSLGGHFVRKLEHHNGEFAGTTFEEWDLTNERGVPIASGMYIAHIEIKLDGWEGATFLKLAVFMPEERLDVY